MLNVLSNLGKFDTQIVFEADYFIFSLVLTGSKQK